MFHFWKTYPLIKGLLTWIPPLNAYRLKRASTGGSDSPRYCYSVWLRHLIILNQYGFRVEGACVGELGPGDSLGVGLAALLSGANRYVGLDVVPFSAKADLVGIVDELTGLYCRKEPVPDHTEFPYVRPSLASYVFPGHLIDCVGVHGRAAKIRSEVAAGIGKGPMVGYRAPWASVDDVAVGSLDLVLSQAVLEHVEDLGQTYRAMHAWLKPGGYASHVIGFVSHHLAPFWNGHWAYSDLEWRIVLGRREFLINREPLSTHLAWASKVGFKVLLLEREHQAGGLNVSALSPQYRKLDLEDAQTSSAMLILQKQ